MKKQLTFLLLLFCVLLHAQNNLTYQNTQISILTIGPGKSLNDAFGHNGIRVKTNAIDVVYDYGRFPFNDPNFYLNFARGKLIYSQGYSNYETVIAYYKSQNRAIKEQVLNLTETEKRNMHSFLETNSLPENKDYLYDFFFDNCATKIRDIAQEITNHNINFNSPKQLKENTFRDLIQQNLNWNSWGSLGIDLALGSIIDRNATPYQYMFLPEYIFDFFEVATLKSNNQKLVTKTINVYSKTNEKVNHSFFSSPLFILGIIGLLIIYITYRDYKFNKRSKWLDIILFGITGVIGVLLLLLWFATDHTATAFNYNLLWAFALNLFVVVQVNKSQPKLWFVKYLKLLVILICLLVFHWIFGVQGFAIALIPLLLALVVRYLYLIQNLSVGIK